MYVLYVLRRCVISYLECDVLDDLPGLVSSGLGRGGRGGVLGGQEGGGVAATIASA